MELGKSAMEDMEVANVRFWKGRSVLVTGGAGFIGYSLATKLAAEGAKVFVLDIKPSLPPFSLHSTDVRKKINYIRGDVTRKKTVDTVLKQKRIQTIFHLAAEAIVDRAHQDALCALETNIMGTWTILDSARSVRTISEIVVASSDKAYGSQAKLPYREDAPLRGMNPYDCSKSCTDLIAQMYGKSYALPVAVVRCGNVFGPGDTNWSRLIPDAFRSSLSGKTLEIRSDGTFKRDYVYVDDAVNAYMTLAARVAKDKLFGEAFNFGNDKPLRVSAVLKELSAVMPQLKFHIRNTAHHEIKHQYLDSSKARRVLGWHARTPAREGFLKAGEWYSQYFSR